MSPPAPRGTREGGGARPDSDFTVCPHCWHINPASRLCARCLADMTLLLQESGGQRWTAPVQSPVPVRARARLSRGQRLLLLGVLVLFGMGQLMIALAPQRRPAPAEAER